MTSRMTSCSDRWRRLLPTSRPASLTHRAWWCWWCASVHARARMGDPIKCCGLSVVCDLLCVVPLDPDPYHPNPDPNLQGPEYNLALPALVVQVVELGSETVVEDVVHGLQVLPQFLGLLQ